MLFSYAHVLYKFYSNIMIEYNKNIKKLVIK